MYNVLEESTVANGDDEVEEAHESSDSESGKCECMTLIHLCKFWGGSKNPLSGW